MNRFATVFYMAGFLALVLACQQTDSGSPVVTNPDPVLNVSYFKQDNTAFRTSHVQCLIDRWRREQGSAGPITLGVINDQNAYQNFFSCVSPASLPAIDFNTYTLLIGVKGNNADGSPSNISSIDQTLIQLPSGRYDYQVTVTGKTSTSGEWFGFTGLTGKISDASLVNLKMTYRVN